MIRRWLLAAVLVGCGGGSAMHGDDGPGGDAGGGGKADSGADAGNHATPDAGTGPIEITVLPDYWQDTIANLPVVFNAADGSVIAVEMTDANGHASHMVGAAVSVTLIKPSGNQGTVTLMDVAPGTALRFGALWMKRPTVTTMHASWPAGPQGVHSYFDVETPCGGIGGYYEELSTSLELDARCTGTVDATVAEYYEDRVAGYLSVTGHAIQPNGTIAFTGAWMPPVTFQGMYSNVPMGSSLIGTLAETYYQERYFDASDSSSIVTTTANSTLGLAYSLPPAPGSELHENVRVSLASGDGNEMIGRRLAYTDGVGLDIGAAIVPNILSSTFDDATQTVHWTTQPGLAPQVVRASLSFPGADGSYPTWIIVAPGTATSVTPPQLPDSLAQYRVVGNVQGSIQLLHVAKPYTDIVGDIDLWYGRSNIDYTTIDWQGAPADLASYVNAFDQFY